MHQKDAKSEPRGETNCPGIAGLQLVQSNYFPYFYDGRLILIFRVPSLR